MKRYWISMATVAIFASSIGCNRQQDRESKKPGSPAKVEHAVKEVDLARVILTPQAEERLGIKTEQVEYRPVRRMRTLGGDIIVPPGRRIVVSAPLAGTLTAPEDGHALSPGARLKNRQPVLCLSPAFLSEREVLQPSDRINLARARADLAAAIAEAEGEVRAAEVQIEAAKVKMERADKLRQENVGSLRAYQEAEAELLLAQAKAKAAQSRLATLQDVNLEVEPGKVTSLSIESPQDGILQKVHAVPGEAVAAGAPLFEVTGIDPVWVRVPVYVGDLDSIDQRSTAGIAGLTPEGGSPVRSARPVAAPPSANTNAATVDLFYQLDNPQADLLPGQRVGVTMPLRSTEESLVVPWSAILYDIHGGAWVYENTEPHVFTRRRVEVRHVVDQTAILSRGPVVGTKVAISGAAELFGTEFGGGK